MGKKDDKEIPVKLEDLEFLIEFFDYQQLITKGHEFNLNKVDSKQQGLNNPFTYY